MYYRGDTRAFTLIEVLISVGIFALMSLAIIQLVISNTVLSQSQSATIEVVGSASTIMNDIHTSALQAITVVGSHAFSGTTYSTSANTLVLKLPSITSTGATVGGQYDYIAYYATGTSAYRLIDAGVGSARPAGSKRLSDAITTFVFTYGNADPTLSTSTVIDVQTQKTVRAKDISTHVREQIYLRNYAL